jgi:hypothetical protein
MLRLPRWLPCYAAALLAGCGGTDLTIESDTTWRGTIDGEGEVAETGTKTFGLRTGQQVVCWSLTKATEAGVMRVYTEKSTWFGLGNDVDFDMTTTADTLTISGCAK